MEKKQIHTGGVISSKDFGRSAAPRNLKMSLPYGKHKEEQKEMI